MRVVKLLVMLMALACVPLLSQAAEVKVTSSTQYLWYQDIAPDAPVGFCFHPFHESGG
jgi:hypothetical protein